MKKWYKPFDWAVIAGLGIALQYASAVYCFIKYGSALEFEIMWNIVSLATMAALALLFVAALIVGIRLRKKSKPISLAVIFGSLGLFLFMELFMWVWRLGLNAI